MFGQVVSQGLNNHLVSGHSVRHVLRAYDRPKRTVSLLAPDGQTLSSTSYLNRITGAGLQRPGDRAALDSVWLQIAQKAADTE